MKEVKFSIWLNDEHFCNSCLSNEVKSFIKLHVLDPWLNGEVEIDEISIKAHDFKEK